MTKSQRCMGLDYGFRRIGIALSDPLGMIAHPYTILHRKTNQADFAYLRQVAEQEEVLKVVVGLPTDSTGEIGEQAGRVIRWARKLSAVISVPITFWDESHSSEQAITIRAASTGRQHRGGRVDDVAAAVILQDYLDAGGAINEPGRPLNTLTGAD